MPLVIAWLIFGLLPAALLGSLAGQLMGVHWDVSPDIKTGVITGSAGVSPGTKLGIYVNQPRGDCFRTAAGGQHCEASTARASAINCVAHTGGVRMPLGNRTVTPSFAHTADELLYTVTAGGGGVSIRCTTQDSDSTTDYYMQVENRGSVFWYRLVKSLVAIVWAGGCAIALVVGPMLWLRRRARRRATSGKVLVTG